MLIFISLQSDVFELLARDTSSFKFLMDGSKVYRNEAICFEVKKLIQKVIRIIAYKYEKVLQVIIIQWSRPSKTGFLWLHNVSSLVPEGQDLIECSFREAQTLQYVLK